MFQCAIADTKKSEFPKKNYANSSDFEMQKTL